MASPRKLLRRALDALDTIEADAARIPDAAVRLDEALGATGRADLARARETIARALEAFEARHHLPPTGDTPEDARP